MEVKGETFYHTARALQSFVRQGIGARDEVIEVLKDAGLHGKELTIAAEKIEKILIRPDVKPNPENYNPWNYFRLILGLTKEELELIVQDKENFSNRLEYALSVFQYKAANGKLSILPLAARQQLKTFLEQFLRSFIYQEV